MTNREHLHNSASSVGLLKFEARREGLALHQGRVKQGHWGALLEASTTISHRASVSEAYPPALNIEKLIGQGISGDSEGAREPFLFQGFFGFGDPHQAGSPFASAVLWSSSSERDNMCIWPLFQCEAIPSIATLELDK